MPLYRVLVRWESSENVLVDAATEEEARTTALDAFNADGNWIPGSETIDDIKKQDAEKMLNAEPHGE